MYHNPQKKLLLIRDKQEQRTIRSIMDTIDKTGFGFNFNLREGHVVEVQLVSAGLAVIPRQLRDLDHLYKLQVPSNRIRRLRNIQLLSNLQVLNISDNRLTTAGLTHLTGCTHLTSVDMSLNTIDTLSPFSGLTYLESLNLQSNQISEIPPLNLPRLKYLNLEKNPITDLRNIHHLESLLDLKINTAYLSTEEADLVASKDLTAIKDYCRHQ